MYLFTRRARIDRGNTAEAMAWSAEITDLVRKITGNDVRLWTTVFSAEVGTMVWASFHPDLAALQTSGDVLQGDKSFTKLVDKGAAFVTGAVNDAVAQIIHGEPRAGQDIEYATSVNAVCADGNFGRGIAVGVELAERVEKITGHQTLFATEVTGAYGAVRWTTGFENIQALEGSQQVLQADASWLQYLDNDAVGAYLPNATTRIFRRVA